MPENKTGKEDLRATALNDINNSVTSYFLDTDNEELWNDVCSSIEIAFQLGVSRESIISKMINSVPGSAMPRFKKDLAKTHNLTDAEIEDLAAPED